MDQYGILLIDQINNQTFYYPVHENILWNPQPILNVSGSGDTFTGALSSVLFEKYVKLGEKSVQHKFESVLSNENLDAAVKFGLEAAQYSLRCNKPVSDKINKNLTVSDWKRYWEGL